MGEILNLINFPVLISSLIGFAVLWWVLQKFLWKPVLNIIDERRESIEQAFQEVDDARDDVEKLKAEYEEHLSKIHAEAQAKVQEAVEKGQQIAAEIRQDAEAQREKLLAKTQEDIAREKDKALAEMRNAAIDLSFTISRRVMQEGLDREAHDRLVQGFIDEIKELS
ncbi:F0F1 ATP synthase subunit B [bacterium]|nr:F0F1 ATP synthase subunit B [bacterium]